MHRYTMPLGFLRDVFVSTGAPQVYVTTSPNSGIKTLGTISVASAAGDHPAMTVLLEDPQAPRPPVFPQGKATYYVSQGMLDKFVFERGIRAWTVDWSELQSRPDMPQK
jgi:hypothetical protein